MWLLAHASNRVVSSASVEPQSKSTELCRQTAVVPRSKSTELCSLAAVIPQSKSTEMWSSAAPFHHDLWYFRHWTNEHFSSMLFIRKNVTSPQSRHSNHWNQYNRPNYWKGYWREPHTHSTEGFERVKLSASKGFILWWISVIVYMRNSQ